MAKFSAIILNEFFAQSSIKGHVLGYFTPEYLIRFILGISDSVNLRLSAYFNLGL